MKRLMCVAIALMAGGTLIGASAAEETGTLNGVVDDPNGAPMSGVSLTLRDQKGAAAVTARSDTTGHFAFAPVPIGEYSLIATADGFRDAVIAIQIEARRDAVRHVRMKIAAVAQELTVSAAVDPVSADGNSDGLQVDKDLLKSLPVMEGNPLATVSLFLDPAASGAQGPSVVVDGVEGSGLDVPETSIKKVFVNKNPYAAEFGRPGKDRIEVTTRPGSLNRIHHRLLFTLRNSALDARNAFAASLPQMQRELFEGEMDGPLPRKKGTFYVGSEYLKDNQSSIVNAVVPSGPLSENIASPQRNWRLLGRTDWQLTPLHNLSIRYNRNRYTRRNQGIGAFDLPERGVDSADLAQEIRIDETAALSPAFVNEFRASVRERTRDSRSLSDLPAVLVPGAFHAGGAQVSQAWKEALADVRDTGNFIHGIHTLRFGGGVKRRAIDLRDESNFGGTFSYSSLADYLANRPFLFAVNRGRPAVSFSQVEAFSFVQDEIRLREGVALLAGLRQFVQSGVGGRLDLAPRLSLAYSPGKSGTVIRLGGGMFYDRQPAAMLQQSLLYDGSHVRRMVVANPVPGSALALDSLVPSLTAIDPRIGTPRLIRFSAGVEQKLGRQNHLSVEYAIMRGSRLYRMRNLNAPLPATGLRPRLDLLNLDQFESSGMSRSQSLAVTFRTGFRSRFELLSQYTLSRSLDDTPGMFALPADNYDLRGEFGRADYDRRHRFNAATIVRLPSGWKLGLIGSLSSGIPFNVTTGFDANHDTVANDRPAGLGRNTGQGPGYANTDVRLSKRFYTNPSKETKSPYVEVRLDAFNVLNHVNPVNYIGTLSSPLYGLANSGLPARQMQLSAKVSF